MIKTAWERFREVWGRRVNTFRSYGNLFDGNGTKAEADAVLQDLARFCGYFDTPLQSSPESKTVDPYASMYAMGKKAVMERIIAQINTSNSVEMQGVLHRRLMEDIEREEVTNEHDFR